ncbi:hypothetical protein [Rubritalea profundi]|uniref:Uncharacterized protein n=1 Tax=Rubritalea profundi TaxID=1658618 RepID=A0A2S7U4A1_9BACT|nr:hypothetical protein [Rubritalea profundi]PQJ29132.1 hypothetical protein BSZ32_11935 [Rubritalea profundi]
MRIPWYLVVLIATAVFGCALWLGVRHKDFIIAPDDQAIAQSVSEWKRKHPSLPQRKRALPSPKPATKTKAPPEKLSAPQIPLGQLETFPSLEHFREHRDYGTHSYIQLAIRLESSGKLDHALLAWERVIDSSDTNAAQSLQASKAITKLQVAQPIWNTDPENNFDLILHINTPTEHKTQISALLGQLSDDIRDASSYQVAPQILLKTTPQRDGYPSPPIRVWLSSTGKQAKETPQLTLHFNEGEAPLGEQLYMAIYRSISGQLQQSSELMPPATLSATETPRESLTTNLTRLHWKELCKSLHVEQEKVPRAVIIIEERSE